MGGKAFGLDRDATTDEGRGVHRDQIDAAVSPGTGAAHLVELGDRLEELQHELFEFKSVKVQEILHPIEVRDGIKLVGIRQVIPRVFNDRLDRQKFLGGLGNLGVQVSQAVQRLDVGEVQVGEQAAARVPGVRWPVFDSLDYIYVPVADVDGETVGYVQTLGAELVWKARGMGTTVACLRGR